MVKKIEKIGSANCNKEFPFENSMSTEYTFFQILHDCVGTLGFFVDIRKLRYVVALCTIFPILLTIL